MNKLKEKIVLRFWSFDSFNIMNNSKWTSGANGFKKSGIEINLGCNSSRTELHEQGIIKIADFNIFGFT